MNDLVIVTPAWDGTSAYEAKAISAPTQVSGKLTAKITTPATLVIDGKSYLESAEISASADTNLSLNYDATVWLDEYGFVVNSKAGAAAAASTKVAMLLSVDDAVMPDQTIGKVATVVYADGTPGKLPLPKDTALTSSNAGTVYNVGEPNDKGQYTLSATTVSTPATVGSVNQKAPAGTVVKLKDGGSIDKDDKTLTEDSVAATNSFDNYFSTGVKFIYIDLTAGSIVVRDGVQPVATIPSGASNKCYAVVSDNSATDKTPVVSAVFLPGVTPAGSVDPNQLVFAPVAAAAGSQAMKTATNTEVTVPVYAVYINGEQKNIPVTKVGGSDATTATTLTANGFYDLTPSATVSGAYELTAHTSAGAASITHATNNKITGVLNDNTITIHNSTILTTAGAKVTDVRTAADQAAKQITATPAGLAAAYAKYADIAVIAVYDATTKTASQIYLLSVGEQKYTVTLNTKTLTSTTSDAKYTISLADTVVAKDGTVTINITAALADGKTAFKAQNTEKIVFTVSGGVGEVKSDAVTTAANTTVPSIDAVTFTMPAGNIVITAALGT